MRGKFLFSALLAAVVAAFALAPKAAQAHGDLVGVRDSFLPGTIVIRTNERALYYFVGPGQAIRYPVGVGRLGMQWSGTAFIDGKYIKPAWEAPEFDPQGLFPFAGGRPRWLAAKSNGCRGDDAVGRWPIRHPRDQQRRLDRQIRVARLHPHA